MRLMSVCECVFVFLRVFVCVLCVYVGVLEFFVCLRVCVLVCL